MKDGLPVKRAARQFAVPVRTLKDMVKWNIDPQNFQSEGETILTKYEETLINHVETMMQCGYSYSNVQLHYLVEFSI